MSNANRTIDLAGTQILKAADGTAAAPSITNDGDTNTGMFFPAADTIAFSEGGVESIRIDSSGNVGVGTTSPSAKLDVAGSLGIRVNEDGAGTKVVSLRSNYSSIGPAIQVSTNDPLLMLTNNTERLRIDSSGNVGVGTATPSQKLEVNGSVKATSLVFSDSTSQSTSAYTGFRNRIINGDMRIDQRNAGASQSITAASPAYTVDRWIVRPTGGTVTGQRVSGSGSTQYVYQITGGASVTQLQFEQKIEANNSYDLAGSNVTISANMSNSLLTTASWVLYYANSTDNFSANTLISSGSWTVSSTISRYSATVAVPAAATTGLYLIIYVGAQTSGTFVIGNVQLEAGSSATAFERRPYGTELALCQRYYQKPGNAVWRGNNSSATGNFYYWMPFAVTMRAAPTMGVGTPTYSNAGSATFFNASSAGAEFYLNVTSGGGYVVVPWTADIEL